MAKIEKYVDKYENILLYKLSKGSGGPSKPRNVGIAKSTTPYLIFMDPDDLVINDGYSTLLTKMEEYDSDILIAARVGANERGQKQSVDFISEKYTYINSNDYDIKLDLLYRTPITLKSIFKKKLITDNKIKFNEKIMTAEDEAFDMKCLSHAKKITKINDIIYQFTIEVEGSITTNVKLRVFKELYEVLTELEYSYKPIFKEEVYTERIMNMINGFYIRKITFLKTPEDIDLACKYVYEAMKKFGFNKFDKLTNQGNVNLLEDIKNKNIQKHVNKHFISRLDANFKELTKLSNKNKVNEKVLKRKIVKMSIKLTHLIDKIKKIIKK